MESVGERLLGDVTVFVNRLNALERRCAELERSRFNAERFYAVACNVETVARMHDVSPYLVREYVRLGLIPTHPRTTPAKIMIRLSDALLLDFSSLRDVAKMKRMMR